MIVREMTHNACVSLLAGERLARLACARDNQPYLVPIYYGFDGNRLYGFTMPGKKLDMLRENPRACLQVEHSEKAPLWKSVIAEVLFRELPAEQPTAEERLLAWSLLSHSVNWWEPGALKPTQQPMTATSPHVFFALEIVTISGREAVSET